jgi:predicted permease
MQTILISLPVFLIIFFGWIFSKTKIIEKDWVHVLNGFAYYIALPSLIISSFWYVDFANSKTWILILESVSIIVLFSVFVFAILSLFKINKITKTTILLGSIVGNTVFIGFPLVGINFGQKYLLQASLISSFFLIIPIILVIIYIQWQHRNKESSFKKEIINLAKNPLIISIVLGILLSFLKLEYKVFESIEKAIAMLGSTASPVALFALGTFLHGQSKKNLTISFFISFLKMIILPAIAIVISLYVFKNNDIKVLTLLSSMPVAVTTFVIAEKFNLDKELIGNSILISTIFSFLIAPLIISFFL